LRSVVVALSICAALLLAPALSHNTVPKIAASQTRSDVERLQKEFFNLLDSNTEFKNAKNFSGIMSSLNTVEGKKLVKSMIDAVVPTVGHDDGKELMYAFWQKLLATFPHRITSNLLEIEKMYLDTDTFPDLITKLIAAGDQSPILDIVNEFLPPSVNVSDFVHSFLDGLNVNNPSEQLMPKVMQLAKPMIDTLLKQNNIDLQADAVMRVIMGFMSSQVQIPKDNDIANVEDGKTGKAKKAPDVNPMALLLPLMGMLGKQTGKNGNIVENVLGMMGNNGNVMESVMSLLNNNGGGTNNILESVMGLMNGAGKQGGGGDNMMAMMMSFMSGMGDRKKQNDKLDMLSSVLDLVSSNGMADNSPLAGVAQIAKNFIGQVKDTDKKPKSSVNDKPSKYQPPKKTANAKDVPSGSISSVLEPLLLKLQADTSSHARLSGVLQYINTLKKKQLDVTSLLGMLSQMPGSSSVFDVKAFLKDVGHGKKSFSDVLSSITDEGECLTLARKVTPYAAKLLLTLSEPMMQTTIINLLSEQTASSLSAFGLRGVTLTNWPQMLGPMLTMLTSGMPLQPVPVLQALQQHATLIITDITSYLSTIRGQPIKQISPSVEREVASLLHTLGFMEHRLSRSSEGLNCIQAALCEAVHSENSRARAAVVATYSVVRTLMVVPTDVPTTLAVLRAAATSAPQCNYGCTAPVPIHATTQQQHHHASAVFDEAAHQEL